MKVNRIRPLIFWEGFPPCGVLIKKVVEHYGDDIVVLATRPLLPFSGLEQEMGGKIEWLSEPDEIWERRELYTDRNLIIHTGWYHSGWLRFDRYMKKNFGARVVVTVDHQFKGTLLQAIASIWFRLFLRRHFDAAFVPGRSGQRLMRFLGMPADRIYVGYYGAYEGIYRPGGPLDTRASEFLFVGQLIKRKSIDVLLDGFTKYRRAGGKWNLRILGEGPLRERCRGEGVIYAGFAEAEQTSERMRNARCFILISREEHWGTVLCEAAASGMLLISARSVGSSVDMLRPGINGVELPDISPESLMSALFYIENLESGLAEYGSQTSIGIAKGYTSDAYYAAFRRMVLQLL